MNLRSLWVTCISLLCTTTAVLADSVPGLYGGSYVIATNGNQITTVTNDDGTVVEYQYDGFGVESGMIVSAGSVALQLQYGNSEDGSGWVQAGALPPMFCMADEYGRTSSVTLNPGMWVVNGEWFFSWDMPEPIAVASFAYGGTGHLASVTLNNGLSMQLAAPAATGVVQQSVYGSDGTLLQSASPIGGTNGVRALPAQLDAIATHLGLGADWAEALTFHLSASGQLTTARNTNEQVVLYLVDAGRFRVGFAPDGTALFYDFTPAYGQGDGSNVDAASDLAGVAPSSIVMTAVGATGMYTDRPAEGAVFGAWIEANGAERAGRLEPPSSALRTPASQSLGRPSKIQSDFYRPIRTRVCVTAVGTCWEHTYYEWVDDGITPGPGGERGGVPANGGPSPRKHGNLYKGDPKVWALLERGLKKANDKLKQPDCKALLERVGIRGQKLSDVMRQRGYNNPSTYLLDYPSIVAARSNSACPGSAVASTTPLSDTVSICTSFGNWNDGMAAVYLIHEMMHTLGYGEGPQYPGFPTSAQINQAVIAACGSN